MIKKEIVHTKNILTKSKLPESDYVINPYIGCTNACRYCYASFMKRFTGHTEKWGEFIDVKVWDNKINKSRLQNKSIFISSVTDCYNEYEEIYKKTRKVLEELLDCNCKVVICTKSKLILRDLNILKKFKNLQVAFSINTLDEDFKNDMDKASSINDRVDSLKVLNENNIYTVLFISPIFPRITNCNEIIERTKSFVNEYWFENLNLRGEYKFDILNYIKIRYPELMSLYEDIFCKNLNIFWEELSEKLCLFCKNEGIKYKLYFYHEKIKK